ncbi:NAD(P)H-binding protein [Limosilactobacillus reuteri]|uniref:NAD(P)H-binding protein n=1 Tax=Limosilactobacillus reuteri TaxID=1598 RepID=UPI001E58366F|nr:NAD(P)H-binding protein [Limosilactobacillus reuteri]MCC4347167.1 NAD(P)H-binding protein [Limosilactobacillus reuteri]MCC4374175.1 NAD(P)H-binding protein [Limosilactobacillus reuteri]MCC4384580.1 NAD(P)H-binding protein [Limosilactobacillus reuteri]
MKLAILAANGQIARIVENRILNEEQFKDVDLTLMLRNSDRLSDLADNPRVTIIEGDLNNPEDVEKAVNGQDMVFNAVIDHDDAKHNRPTRNIIDAMKKDGVNRLILTNLLGIYDEVPGEFGKWNRDTCFGGTVTEDNAAVMSDKLAAESGLDYTTLRLPWLNDRDEIKYTITHKDDEFVGVSGSRQSIADVVLKIVANPTFGSNDSLGIADSDTQGSNRPVY